jgi:F0F1-type ATP synthase assembly protein I
MSLMVRLLLLGVTASMVVGAVIALGLNAVDASGEVGGIAFVLGACIAGLIGAAVSHRMPPPGQQH